MNQINALIFLTFDCLVIYMIRLLKDFKRRMLLGITRGRLFILRVLLGGYVDKVVVRSGNSQFVVSLADNGVGRTMMKLGAYSPEELEVLDKILSKTSKVLVVGAHVGGLAVPISDRCASVTCIEANPDTFELLELNKKINGADNITLYNFAAGEKKGELEFLLSTDNSGGSKRYPIDKQEMYFYDAPKVVSVPMRALDEELPDDFDVVVMDIEGSEYFALQGMQKIISRAQVLIIEFIPHHLKFVANIDVETFLEPISKHFERLEIPSQGRSVESGEFLDLLSEMYREGLYDNGIVFSKIKD